MGLLKRCGLCCVCFVNFANYTLAKLSMSNLAILAKFAYIYPEQEAFLRGVTNMEHVVGMLISSD